MLLSALLLSSLPTISSTTVVVELFTSEGCSSCPPAEDLMTNLRDEARRKHAPIIFLSEHVDYWDQLGWRDHFALKEASDRQQELIDRLHARAMYTPEMVVDGRAEFVGADKARAASEIAGALRREDTVQIQLSATRYARTVSIEATLSVAKGTLYIFAIEDRVTEVKAGENAGRMLAHPAVARATVSMPANATKLHTSLTIPDDATPANLIAFIDTGDGIEGATMIPFSSVFDTAAPRR